MKRYKLTDKGEKFYEEQARFGERLRKKLEFLAPMLVGGFQMGINGEKLREIREPATRLITALLDLRIALKENLTKQTAREEATILNDNAEKLEQIILRIKKG